MNKIIKRISIILLSTITLTTANCFAATQANESTITKGGTTYICRTYEVSEQEESQFISLVSKQITVDKKDYIFDSMNKSGGNATDTIDIQTTKEVVTNSSNAQDILSRLPQVIDYNENGYVGQYQINTDSIQTVSQYNGYKKVLVEGTKQYSDLDKNDLSYIPKQITKDGINIDLITITWHEQTTKLIGSSIVPDKYTAECYYAGKKKVDNPLTYTTTVSYTGIAAKTTENPLMYNVEYKCITKDTNYIPYAIGGTGAIFTAIAIFFRRKSKKDKEAAKVNEK